MSTKIYYAYRMKSEFLADFMMKLEDKRNEMYKEARKKVIEYLVLNKVDVSVDEFMLKHLKKRESIFYDLDLNTSLSISVQKDGFTYIKLFGTQNGINELHDFFTSLLYVEDYHYQNQTDHPEDTTYEDFQKRGEKWDKITGGSTYISMIPIQIIPDFILEPSNYMFKYEVEREIEKLSS